MRGRLNHRCPCAFWERWRPHHPKVRPSRCLTFSSGGSRLVGWPRGEGWEQDGLKKGSVFHEWGLCGPRRTLRSSDRVFMSTGSLIMSLAVHDPITASNQLNPSEPRTRASFISGQPTLWYQMQKATKKGLGYRGVVSDMSSRLQSSPRHFGPPSRGTDPGFATSLWASLYQSTSRPFSQRSAVSLGLRPRIQHSAPTSLI